MISKVELVNKADRGEALSFVFFWGHTEKDIGQPGPWMLSQWYPSPFTVDGVDYPTAEHFMMAQKAALFADHDIRQQILASDDPGTVKALGRRIRRFDGATWDRERERIVTQGSTEKFRQNPALREYLESTGDKILVEASPKDSIWGIGLAGHDPLARDPRTWKGLNLLGFCLMRARAALRSSSSSSAGGAAG